MSVTVEKKFRVPIWDEAVKRNAIDFWSRRRITFSETSANTLVGTRGSLFGNLFTFDMSKLIANLKITASEQNELHCVLHVNTVFQWITEYNRAWWNLEMETFESFLLQEDEQGEKWKKFGVGHKKAVWLWSFTFGIGDRKMPPPINDKSDEIAAQLRGIKQVLVVAAVCLLVGAAKDVYFVVDDVRENRERRFGFTFYEQATNLRRERAWDELLKLAQSRLVERPRDPYAFWFSGIAHFKRDELNQAQSDFKRMVEVDEDFEEAGDRMLEAIKNKRREKLRLNRTGKTV